MLFCLYLVELEDCLHFNREMLVSKTINKMSRYDCMRRKISLPKLAKNHDDMQRQLHCSQINPSSLMSAETPSEGALMNHIVSDSQYTFQEQICCSCLSETMLRCKTCKRAYYCSRQCQKQDFALHSIICELLNERLYNFVSDSDSSITFSEFPLKLNDHRVEKTREIIIRDLFHSRKPRLNSNSLLFAIANNNHILVRYLLRSKYIYVAMSDIQQCYIGANAKCMLELDLYFGMGNVDRVSSVFDYFDIMKMAFDSKVSDTMTKFVTRYLKRHLLVSQFKPIDYKLYSLVDPMSCVREIQASNSDVSQDWYAALCSAMFTTEFNQDTLFLHNVDILKCFAQHGYVRWKSKFSYSFFDYHASWTNHLSEGQHWVDDVFELQMSIAESYCSKSLQLVNRIFMLCDLSNIVWDYM